MCIRDSLRLYCRFDSYRERSILSGNEDSFIAAFFVQNCNFSDRFVSETGLKILILSAGMDADYVDDDEDYGYDPEVEDYDADSSVDEDDNEPV